jgi:hypothetical protein
MIPLTRAESRQLDDAVKEVRRLAALSRDCCWDDESDLLLEAVAPFLGRVRELLEDLQRRLAR